MSMMLSPENAFRILCWLRVAAVAGQLLAIAAARWLWGPGVETAALLTVSGAFALWQGVLWLQVRGGRALGEKRLALEILVDIGVITALLCLAGGWNNPFAAIYLVPLGFAAAVLPLPLTLGLLGGAMAGYGLTATWFVPLPHIAPLHGDAVSMHLVGMAVSFLLASGVLVVAVSLVRRAHDRERRALAHERESRLRDEHLLSLGVLAASTAHELGTPLSTARMLVEELEHQDGEMAADVGLLARQLDYAMDRLRRLVRVADRNDQRAVDLETFCAQIADGFRTLRPETELCESHCLGTAPGIRYSRPLESAVLSLLVNAAAASARAGSTRVEFAASLEGTLLTLRIRDFGPGFGGDAGQPGTRSEGTAGGLGVGLVISSATIERHGGEARHFHRRPGTEVVVNLPLDDLAAVP